jgi:cyclic beta-1,2-glucan synthetase
MRSLEQHLVRRDEGLVLLFTPPFDTAPVDPGYIKGYLPGLRENGGQFTHAAMWVLMAQAALKDQDQVATLLEMLNPIRRSDSPEQALKYRVEPYVLASDVYSGGSLSQRGGWTWYTGAAGWFYRAILESVLGVRLRDDRLHIDPCVPSTWDAFEVAITRPGIDYRVQMQRVPAGEEGLLFDGVRTTGNSVPLLRDGQTHTVLVLLQADRPSD